MRPPLVKRQPPPPPPHTPIQTPKFFHSKLYSAGQGCLPLCQNFRKFRSKRKWNGLAQVEIFLLKWSTSRGGPLWLVGPDQPKIAVPFSEIVVSSPAPARHYTH